MSHLTKRKKIGIKEYYENNIILQCSLSLLINNMFYLYINIQGHLFYLFYFFGVVNNIYIYHEGVCFCFQIIPSHLEPLTEQQILAVCGLQQSTQEAEEALSQGLEALNQSLSDTITSDSLSCPPNMANYMGQMALAMNKLSTLEGFVRQVRPSHRSNFQYRYFSACDTHMIALVPPHHLFYYKEIIFKNID